MKTEHTDLNSLLWDKDEDGIYLGGKLKLSGLPVIVALHLAEVDAKAIVRACNAHDELLVLLKKCESELRWITASPENYAKKRRHELHGLHMNILDTIAKAERGA